MHRFAPILLIPAAFAMAVPAAAAPKAHPPHRDPTSTLLNARLASLNARIAILNQEQAISREEALDLRDQSRAITRRLMGKSARDTRDIEFALQRLESEVRFATDDARWGRHVFAEGEEHHIDREPYQVRWDEDYEHFDRYVAPPVDRWHDPFDRGN